MQRALSVLELAEEQERALLKSPAASSADIDSAIERLGAGRHRDFIRSLYEQESSSGRADTSRPNYAGARGPLQVMPATFDGLKRQGLLPADYDISNQEHATEAGIRLASMLADKYGGDYRKAAAAYYSGEKAVRGDGSIADFRDPKNAKAPTTTQYADAVISRIGSAKPQGEAPAGKQPKKWEEIARAESTCKLR